MKVTDMAMMRAVQLFRFGGPAVLELRSDAAQPRLEANEVLVRVRASGVNPGDVGVRSGQLWFMTGRRFPLTPGLDVAGVVERSASPAFSPGDEVLGFGLGAAKAYAELVALPATQLGRRPPGLDWASAAALPCAGCTTLQCLDEHARLRPGDRILIRGASGGVGHLAVQLARQRNAHVTAVAGDDAHGWLRRLGADVTLSTAPAALESVEPFDVVLDVKGGLAWSALAKLTRPGARVVTTTPSLQNLAFGWAAPLSGAPAVTAMVVKPRRADLETLARAVAKGDLEVKVSQTFPLAGAADAHRRLEQGRVRGKLVLEVS
jgi:NADPH:quinone reductase-like Zn-dependent oxidoreductase